MKFDRDVTLACGVCGEEGLHELLYLSEHLRASRCGSCGHAGVYSSDLRADYAADLAGRFLMLPRKFAGEAARHPIRLLWWPIKALRKPLKILREIDRVEDLRHDRQRSEHLFARDAQRNFQKVVDAVEMANQQLRRRKKTNFQKPTQKT